MTGLLNIEVRNVNREGARMMKRPWGIVMAGAVAIAALVGVWVSMGSSSHSMSGMSTTESAASSSTTMTEKQFITEMIPHHQSAVEMAQLGLEKGTRPEIKTLARGILSAQEGEISQMQVWYRSWFGGAPPTTTMDHTGTDGAMAMGGEAEALKSSKNFDLDFIAAMIPHHTSAISMANQLLLGKPRAELKTLAQAIVTGQQKEIDQMEDWRKSWSS